MRKSQLDDKCECDNSDGKLSRKELFTQALNFFSIKRSTAFLPKELSVQEVSQVSYHNCENVEDEVKIIQYEKALSHSAFQDLSIPPHALLHIFSYLDVFSLCRASQVCISWWNLSNDYALWEEKLQRNSQTWHVIDYLSHPNLLKKENPDLSAKEIYIRCCPENSKLRYSNHIHLSFTSLSYYFGLSTPRVVMFGSGLNSKGLVKRLLWDKQSPFTIKGMFPGQFEGYGSGVTLQYNNGTFNLITLYSQTKNIREQQPVDGEVGPRSKLLVRGQNDEYVLSEPVRELCTTVDAFIYIIKATTEENLMLSMDEFQAIIDERWLQHQAPLLILCVVPNADAPCIPVLHVANQLNLAQLTRRWQVRQCHSSSLYGILPGVSWLTKQIY